MGSYSLAFQLYGTRLLKMLHAKSESYSKYIENLQLFSFLGQNYFSWIALCLRATGCLSAVSLQVPVLFNSVDGY